MARCNRRTPVRMLETETMLMRIARAIRRAQALVWVVSGASLALGQVTPDPYRGLWVGQVTLRYVNEVSVPLDENNVAVAPNPDVPTPTADAANLRLIVHVNGAGQVSLLRDVAILNRKGGGNARAILDRVRALDGGADLGPVMALLHPARRARG